MPDDEWPEPGMQRDVVIQDFDLSLSIWRQASGDCVHRPQHGAGGHHWASGWCPSDRHRDGPIYPAILQGMTKAAGCAPPTKKVLPLSIKELPRTGVKSICGTGLDISGIVTNSALLSTAALSEVLQAVHHLLLMCRARCKPLCWLCRYPTQLIRTWSICSRPSVPEHSIMRAAAFSN